MPTLLVLLLRLTMDWDRAWEIAGHDSYIWSPAYDAHCFDPKPAHTPHGRGSVKPGVPLDEILWAKKPGRYTTRCPIHDDAQASLSILITDEGEFVVNCFAGCDWREVKDYIRKHT
ncbi:MAG TPA: hypothetical protein VIY48_13185 [Candidatus Paceibacterota bacterium]